MTLTAAARWPARTIDWRRPIEGAVCATMWPTRVLQSRERWFDELYVWTEGFQASTTQRARIQLTALRNAFWMLESERVHTVGVTLSFGTVERYLDLVAENFDAHRLVAHRMVVILRGSIDRIRSRYRIRAFVDLLRSQQIMVGYRVTSPRVSMELKSLDFLEPDFAKLLAPHSLRAEYWDDFALEARVAGVRADWLVVAGLELPAQVGLARGAGIRFGQGSAVKPAFTPPLRTPLSEGPPSASDRAEAEQPQD